MDGPVAPAEAFVPWNKGRGVGQKSALSPDEVGVIKTVLGNKNRLRDLALFSVALDTLLRASDVLALRVGDLQDAGGGFRDKLTILQKKTNRTLPVELSEATRVSIGAQPGPTISTQQRQAFRRYAALRASSLGAASSQPKGWSSLRRRSWSTVRGRLTGGRLSTTRLAIRTRLAWRIRPRGRYGLVTN